MSTISKRKEAGAPVVLLVEDEALLRVGLTNALRAEGLRVVAVPSALHALQLLEKLQVDLVVADFKMPGPSGLRLLETVRDCWPRTRRLMLTGYATPALRRSPAVDTLLDKSETAEFVIDAIVNEARRRHGQGR